jgi:hypothetical protein
MLQLSGFESATRPRIEFAHPARPQGTALPALGVWRECIRNAYSIPFERLMTDNGSDYSYSTTIRALACIALGIKHVRTRHYRPSTNGKTERLIRAVLGGRVYGAIYRDSDERRDARAGWLDRYSRRRAASSRVSSVAPRSRGRW